MEQENKQVNYWMVASIVLGVILLILIFYNATPKSEASEMSRLIKVASNNYEKSIKICNLENAKCTPMLNFKPVGTGICKVPNPTCDLFKRIKLIK